MNIALDDEITPEAFRQTEAFRAELTAFLKTPCGASVLYILKNARKAKIPSGVIAGDEATRWMGSLYMRDAGANEAVELIESLRNPPAPKSDIQRTPTRIIPPERPVTQLMGIPATTP